MRFIYLQHIPYRHLSEDFAARFPESVVTTPYFGVAEPRLVHADIRAGLDEIDACRPRRLRRGRD